MLVFFRCVAEAVMENGVKGLASLVPGGEFACKVAAAAYKKYSDRKKEADQKKEIEALAQASFESAKSGAVEAVKQAMAEVARSDPQKANLSEADRIHLELYLSQVPAAVQQSLKRPEDPSGRTAPPAFAINSPADVTKLLPPRAPRFKPGDALTGKPGWVLERPLGVGGFGEVWLAKHHLMASLSGAVKFCHGQQARDLRHEGGVIDRVMAAGAHPNIVPLKDVHLDGDPAWLMFEFVSGGDLADLIRAWQRKSRDERVANAVFALSKLADAVGHFHNLTPAVVHRDLKPSNILFDRSTKRLRITDFGIGSVASRAALDQENRGASTAAGRMMSYMRGSHTPLYSSPQQRLGSDPDPRDDVHALGVIGYQLITGQLEHGAGPDFAEDLHAAGATTELITLLGQCVAQKPERRPVDARELARRLTGVGAAPVPPPPAVARPTATAAERTAPRIAPPPLPAPPTSPKPAVQAELVPIPQELWTAAPRPTLPPPPAPSSGNWVVTIPAAAFSRPVGDSNAQWRRVAKANETVASEPGCEYALVVHKTATDAKMAPLAQLRNVPALVRVELSECRKLSEEGLRHLAALTQLRELSLSNTEVTDGLLASLSGLTKLEALNLEETAVGDRGLAYLAALTAMRALVLRATAIGGFGLDHLSRMTALRYLDIGATRVRDVGLKGVPKDAVGGFIATDVPLQDSGMFYVGQMRGLEVLDVAGTGMTDVGCVQLTRLTRLTVLHLGRNAITDAGLSSLSRLPELSELNVSGCARVADAGVAALARLPKLSQLTLDGAAVTDSGVATLRQAVELEELSLEGCQGITDAVVDHLVKFTKLNAVAVSGTRVTGNGLAKLREAIPKVL